MLCAHGDTYTGRDKVITQDNMPFTRNAKDLLLFKAWDVRISTYEDEVIFQL